MPPFRSLAPRERQRLVQMTCKTIMHQARVLLSMPTNEEQPMQTNQSEPIRDHAGNVLGSIETQANGDQVLRNAQEEVRGYYESEGDFTRDADKNIVAKGNKLRSMIC